MVEATGSGGLTHF